MGTYIKVILLSLSVVNLVRGREIPSEGFCYDTEIVDGKTRLRERCCYGYQFWDGKCVKMSDNSWCQCQPGYQSNPGSSYCDCKPICDIACENGKCLTPNKCQCNDAYEFDRVLGDCTPICNPSCVKGGCIAPNKCSCFDGYKLKLGSKILCIPEHVADECEKGYIYHAADDECKPNCSPSCVNGRCTGPNQCICNDGFKRSHESPNKCIPVDEIECESGQQAVNGHCTWICHPPCKNGISNGGYNPTYASTDRYVPDNEPICEPSCAHGKCVGRNQCECDKGFTPYPIGSSNCISLCDLSDYCQNGRCTYPDTCVCHNGYRPSDKHPNNCEPIEQQQSFIWKEYVRKLSQNETVRVSIQTLKN